MKKTSEDLVAWAKEAYANGWVYWYGTSGYKCTTGLLNSKTNQYPSHYTSKRRATYEQHIAEGRVAADCIGLFKSYAWDKDGDIDTVGGKYGSNDHPDKSTKQVLAACKVKGDISTIPEIPGLAVWTASAGHIGVYVGNGEVIELKGYSDNCQWNKLSERTFTTWGLYPYVEYTAEQVALAKAAAGMAEDDGNASSGASSSASKVYKLGDRTLSKGTKGEDVRELQRILRSLGYTLEIDGQFGPITMQCVKSFQGAEGLARDGIVGPLTLAALNAAESGGRYTVVISGLLASVAKDLTTKYGGTMTPEGGEDNV